MAGASYHAIRLYLKAEIAGIEFQDVVQFASSFELNSIPSANLQVAVGQSVDGQKVATIHNAMSKLKIQVPAKVTLLWKTVDRQNVPSNDMDGEGQLTIFDGYATGVGWQRSTTTAAATINLQHWLSDLDYSSALSGHSHPGNPADWSYSSTFRTIGLGAATTSGDRPCWLPNPAGAKGVSYEMLTAPSGDLWDRVIKEWMMSLAAMERDPIDERLRGGGAMKGGGNAAALKALKRMFSAPALGLNLDGVADGNAIANGIRAALGRESWRTWANTTLWGKLVGEFSPAYFFAVVPRVNDALIVPFCGGLQGEVHRTLQPSEYAQCDLSAFLPRALRAVGIHHPIAFNAGGHNNAAGVQVSRSGLAALALAQDKDRDGLIMLKDPPLWLCDPTQPYNYSYDTTAQAGRKTRGYAIGPPVGTAATKDEAKRDPAATERDNVTVLQRFAEHWFALETLKGRAGELAGRLRFDIAPGSQVKVMMGTSVNLDVDQLAEPLYGTVTRVSNVINAEMQRAGTSLSLAHLRTEAENNDPDTSVPAPPLYKAAWRGATLTS
jgi:hypothetical protein